MVWAAHRRRARRTQRRRFAVLLLAVALAGEHFFDGEPEYDPLIAEVGPPEPEVLKPERPRRVLSPNVQWAEIAQAPIHVVEPDFPSPTGLSDSADQRMWISADLHLHNVARAGPEDTDLSWTRRFADRAHLQVMPVLLWGYQLSQHEPRVDAAAAGQHPVMNWGFETSGNGFGTLGHGIVLGRTASTAGWDDFSDQISTVPLANWVASRRDSVLFGMAHVAGDLLPEAPELTANPGAPLELPVHAANGRVSFVTFESVPDTVRNEMGLWTRLQNSGIRLPITAGTDFPCNDATEEYGPGWHRTYVLVPARWSYHDFLEGIRAGHTTIATGWSALLDLRVGRSRVGDKVSARRGEKLSFSVTSILDQDAPVDVFVNGDERMRLSVAAGRQVTPFELSFDESAWVYIRTRTAMTSPIYVNVDGKPFQPTADATCALARYVRSLKAALLPMTGRLGKFRGATFAAYDRAEQLYLKRFRDAGGKICE